MTMPTGGDITADWFRIRDTLQANDALLAEIRAELAQLPPEVARPWGVFVPPPGLCTGTRAQLGTL
ncbi:hypothetical protein JBE04_05020 [Streptomyces sp. PRKS01-29]|nr:hypothetical protein [Streptomyces sabulosicollis]MBI0293871.1 hypothetical protein [Streptomyces sabulosicollis]